MNKTLTDGMRIVDGDLVLILQDPSTFTSSLYEPNYDYENPRPKLIVQFSRFLKGGHGPDPGKFQLKLVADAFKEGELPDFESRIPNLGQFHVEAYKIFEIMRKTNESTSFMEERPYSGDRNEPFFYVQRYVVGKEAIAKSLKLRNCGNLVDEVLTFTGIS